MKIAFYQTPYNSVIYTLADSDESFTLEYYKFKEYLYKNFFIKDLLGIEKELDRFSTVILMADGSFILHEFDFNDLTRDYESLKKFNKKKEEKEVDPITALYKRARISAEKLTKKIKKPLPWYQK